jgi:hypothetical protein
VTLAIAHDDDLCDLFTVGVWNHFGQLCFLDTFLQSDEVLDDIDNELRRLKPHVYISSSGGM